ncbi:MAG: limonene-1,2-epoxide hydrolase family protein [Thermoplasmata archaeon]
MTASPSSGPTSKSREQQTLDFFARWGVSFDEFCQSFVDTFTDATVWDQRPVPRLTGASNAIRFLKLARVGMRMETVDVEILSIASSGDIVHVQRIDHLRRADGSGIASAAVAGVLEFDGDRIVRWREYFDAGSFVGQSIATSLLHLVRWPLRRFGST